MFSFIEEAPELEVNLDLFVLPVVDRKLFPTTPQA
jgi:hypothetical protein